MGTIQTVRLSCSWFWVDIRLIRLRGAWVASADLPAGPSVGVGSTAQDAIAQLLDEFEGVIDELLASAPEGLLKPGVVS